VVQHGCSGSKRHAIFCVQVEAKGVAKAVAAVLEAMQRKGQQIQQLRKYTQHLSKLH
jgi:hypothetical protein